MALKGQISLSILSVSILAFQLSIWFFPTIAGPAGKVSGRSPLPKDVSGPSKTINTEVFLSGISIQDAWEFPVVQQPAGDTNYVSKNNGEVTQFASASRYGNVGLLAHNYLSGKSFSQIQIGQEIQLVYSDGRVEDYTVTEILRYKALEPRSPYSSFQSLDDPEEILTVGEMFDRAYQGERHVTLQTCIAGGGISSWGRLFVIASPELDSLGMGSLIQQESP